MPNSSKLVSPLHALFQLPSKFWSKLECNRLDFLYDRADDMADLGLSKVALKLYLHVFEETRSHTEWAGVRLSFLLSRIAKIGDSYQPAELCLQKMCEDREASMRSEDTDLQFVLEYLSICRHSDRMRPIRFYDELKVSHPEFVSTLGWLKLFDIKQFLETKRYSDYSLNECEGFLKLLKMKTHWPDGLLYAEGPEPGSHHKNWIVGIEADYYECILGADHEDLAAEFSQMLIEMEPTAETFITLIGAAVRSGRSNTVEELLNKADSTLSHESMLHVLAVSKKKAMEG